MDEDMYKQTKALSGNTGEKKLDMTGNGLQTWDVPK